jgi:hypothetical protein
LSSARDRNMARSLANSPQTDGYRNCYVTKDRLPWAYRMSCDHNILRSDLIDPKGHFKYGSKEEDAFYPLNPPR